MMALRSDGKDFQEGFVRFGVLLVAACVFSASSSLSAAPTPPPLISVSDSELLAYARSPFRQFAHLKTRETLGLHRGVPVVVDFACSDLCPAYLTRIIHYNAPANEEDCAHFGGVIRREWVPVMMGRLSLPFCEPKILADAGIASSR